MNNNSSLPQRATSHTGTVFAPKIFEGATPHGLYTSIKNLEQRKCRKGEIFKRINITTFIDLLLQIEKLNRSSVQIINNEEDPNDSTRVSSVDSVADNEVKRITSSHSRVSSKADTEKRTNSRPVSTLSDIIRRLANKSININGEPIDSFNQYPEDMPYLLLDVRSKSDFLKCHIHTAVSHPHTMLTQSNSFETRELLACRNREGTFIVLYDEDEVLAMKVIESLIERGYENVYLLSGGLKEAIKKFPNGLIGGILCSNRMQTNSKQNNNSRASCHSTASHQNNDNDSEYHVADALGNGPHTRFITTGSKERPIRIGFSEESTEELLKQLRDQFYTKITSQPNSTTKDSRILSRMKDNNCSRTGTSSKSSHRK